MNLEFSKVKGLILDLDGVLWRSDEPIGDLPKIFQQIKNKGWKVMLASNNATRSSEFFREKMKSFGVELEPWQVINSPQVTAEYLHKKFPQGGSVYIIGEEGIRNALAEKGFFHGENNVLAVIVGLDRKITYNKLAKATSLIRDGIPFIGTNPDKTYPTPEGLVPGAGAIIAAVEAASGVTPIYMGKPQPEMFKICLERMGLNPYEVIAVGDRLETDIAAGQAVGCNTALVLSGVTTLDKAQEWDPPIDWIGKDLYTLVFEN
jgi:4-nitrophenyl phosphatase